MVGEAGQANAPFWSWSTGWFNLLGQIGVIAWSTTRWPAFIGYFINLYNTDFVLDTEDSS